jgi:hypothetical protein
MGAGAYYSSGWKYATTGDRAAYHDIGDGSFKWNTAPSGTAGNAISFTQAMTLNASGNLSVGNTNDTYKLDVSGTGRFTGTLTDDSIIYYQVNWRWNIQVFPHSDMVVLHLQVILH